MNLPLITGQQSVKITSQAAVAESSNRSDNAKQAESDGFSGVLSGVKSDETDSKAHKSSTSREHPASQDHPASQKHAASQDHPAKSALPSALPLALAANVANTGNVENSGNAANAANLASSANKENADEPGLPLNDTNDRATQALELNKPAGVAMPDKQPEQKLTDMMLQSLVSANAAKPVQVSGQAPTLVLEQSQSQQSQQQTQQQTQQQNHVLASRIDQAGDVLLKSQGAEVDGKAVAEKVLPILTRQVLPRQVIDKNLEVEVKKQAADLVQTATDKTVSRAQIIAPERPANVSDAPLAPAKPVPPKQLDLARQGAQRPVIGNVAVTERHQETHLPPAVVDHAWNQIGQKIAQSLGKAASVQTGANPVLIEQDGAMGGDTKQIKHLTIQLKPENLGTVSVKLMLTNGRLDVTLSASDGHLAGRLQQSTNHLSAQLKASGISFDGLSIQVAESDTSSGVRGQNTGSGNDTNQNFGDQNNSRQSLEGKGTFGQAGNQATDQSADIQDEGDDNETILQGTGVGSALDGTVYL